MARAVQSVKPGVPKLFHAKAPQTALASGRDPQTHRQLGLGSNNRFSDLKSIFIWMFRYRLIKSQDRSFYYYYYNFLICIFPWMREVSLLVSRGLWFLTQRDLFLIMHQVRGFLVQFTALVLWESISYPSKIGIVTEITLTESISNRIRD